MKCRGGVGWALRSYSASPQSDAESWFCREDGQPHPPLTIGRIPLPVSPIRLSSWAPKSLVKEIQFVEGQILWVTAVSAVRPVYGAPETPLQTLCEPAVRREKVTPWSPLIEHSTGREETLPDVTLMSNLAGGCRQKHSLPVWSKTQAHVLTSQIGLAWVWEDLDLQTGKRAVCCTLTGWEITEAKDSVFDIRELSTVH